MPVITVKKFSKITKKDAKEILEATFDMEFTIVSIKMLKTYQLEVITTSEWVCEEEDGTEDISEQEDYFILTPISIGNIDFESDPSDQDKYRQALFLHGYIDDNHYNALPK